MNPFEAKVLLVFGLLLVLAGVAWWLGPLVLVCVGSVIAVIALLAPEKESRGEPAGKDAAPRR